MGKGSAPKAPDPQQTAAASTSTNIGTAIANSMLGNVNQITPDGSLTYSQSGTTKWTDPYTGKSYDIPSYTATQSLSGNQQAIKDQTDAAQLNLAGLANDQSGAIRDRLATPFEFDNRDAENWAYDLASARILPQQQRNEEALRTRLLNSGLREGSAAWNAEMQRLTNANTDQLNQLALTGRQSAYNEARDQYTLPINSITALLSGSQISNPNFVNTSQPTIPTTDVAGIINQNYQNKLGAYQNRQSGIGGLLTGVGNLAGSMIGLSDDDAKKDKKRLGNVEGEMGLWEFHYKGEPSKSPKHVGLMASEVEKVRPSAVKRGKDGLRRVHYGKALGLMGA